MAWSPDSRHFACGNGGTASVLVMVFGRVLLAGAIMVALIGWSRVALGDHTTGQVLAGTAVGTTLSAIIFGLLAWARAVWLAPAWRP